MNWLNIILGTCCLSVGASVIWLLIIPYGIWTFPYILLTLDLLAAAMIALFYGSVAFISGLKETNVYTLGII